MREEKESDIQSAICDYLALRKHLFWRSNNIPVYDKQRGAYRALPKHTPRGLPDINVVKDGFYIGLEVKKKSGRQSPDQKDFETRIKKAGGEYYLVHSIDEVQNIGL